MLKEREARAVNVFAFALADEQILVTVDALERFREEIEGRG